MIYGIFGKDLKMFGKIFQGVLPLANLVRNSCGNNFLFTAQNFV